MILVLGVWAFVRALSLAKTPSVAK